MCSTRASSGHDSLRDPPPDPPRPLSRLYLVAAAAALTLGLVAAAVRIVRPPLADPGGCIEAEFVPPDNLHVPDSVHLLLRACPHISETTIDVALNPAFDHPERGGGVLSGSGPEGPGRWPEYLRIRWRSADTIEVSYTQALRLLSRARSAGPVGIVWLSLPALDR